MGVELVRGRSWVDVSVEVEEGGRGGVRVEGDGGAACSVPL